jgi:ribonuclease/clavin/mitogillin
MASERKAVRDAASVVLVRRGSRGPETFWVRRGDQLNFAGGFYAFPGGRLDQADGELPLRNAEDLGALERALLGAAARELFEETGVLAVRGASRVTRAERDRVRARLVERPVASGRKALPGTEPATAEAPRDEAGEAAGFGALLARHGLAIDARDFAPAGRWVTPPMMPVRFDARFYLVELPDGEEAVVWPGELADGQWIRPADALARWEAGTALLHPPAWHTLRCLDLPEARTDLRASLPTLQTPARAPWKLPIEDFVVHQLEFQRGLITVPLLTPTLPPATHTNCLLLGDDELWVVDPGSPYEGEQAVLERQLDRLAAGGRKPVAILLTHFHHDHVAGAPALSRKLGLPIVAHAETRARLDGEVRVDRLLGEGERLEVGPRGFRALHLPGHTRGHLCLIEDGTGAVVAGDLISGVSTVVIDPPEGDMADYIESLRRLSDLGPGAIYPAHGPVVPGGLEKLAQTLAHRLEREGKVMAALAGAGAPALAAELVPAAYPDVAPDLYPLAERSLLAHLLKLVKDGRARDAGHDRYAAV